MSEKNEVKNLIDLDNYEPHLHTESEHKLFKKLDQQTTKPPEFIFMEDFDKALSDQLEKVGNRAEAISIVRCKDGSLKFYMVINGQRDKDPFFFTARDYENMNLISESILDRYKKPVTIEDEE
ncbi:MAG: hypothetical protein A3C61_01155 [Candidatus Yanofskybacteria bacterium RIFCSPHIGHO2_02_FULL_39_10]|uniref:Uncharacterized protein n=1 Tax=Candidatus Yanofskybacteria bacterium RIFCSPHIGHO2_02_FULL_39_10 TaxID=1802674 RepID=A0A1F8FA95_9BACT|nr:MAG: hypothetical protein A3C61_01155 [Candidatus Yanofskybacteria bacterium RIFCSPHIGHO2_02_FULL_39_10]